MKHIKVHISSGTYPTLKFIFSAVHRVLNLGYRVVGASDHMSASVQKLPLMSVITATVEPLFLNR